MKRLLVIFALLISPSLIAQKSTFFSLDQPTGLVGWWKLGEGTGSTAKDSSGNADNGTWEGTASGTSGFYSQGDQGPWGGYFDGTNNYVSVPSTVNLNPSSVSLTAWIYQRSTSTSIAGVAAKDISGGITNTPYALLTLATTPYAQWGITTSANSLCSCSSSTAISLNAWHFLAGTFDTTAGRGYLYVDGVQVCNFTATGPIGSTAATLNIGQHKIGASRWFPGLIDDVRVYNRALAAGEIAGMYLVHN
jgi:hypothetical protein